jgi:ADP-ribose pyrophosphatase YjhB (NUDIX family)
MQVTLIREYAQGPNALMYCLPTGALDPQRHKDMAECAARELSEEVRTRALPGVGGLMVVIGWWCVHVMLT